MKPHPLLLCIEQVWDDESNHYQLLPCVVKVQRFNWSRIIAPDRFKRTFHVKIKVIHFVYSRLFEEENEESVSTVFSCAGLL